MRINFLLPFYSRLPIGGFRVHYEYANHLSRRSHDVTVVHPCTVERPKGLKARLARAAKRSIDSLANQRTVSWHTVDEAVRLLSVPDLQEKYLPPADMTVATGWATAEMLPSYSSRLGKKFQIAYDYELWMTAKPKLRQRMSEAFRGVQNVIASSSAVAEMLESCGVRPIAKVPCGLDLEAFRIEVPIEDRKWGTIGIPVREQPSKGTSDALEALSLLRAHHGESLSIVAFGPKRLSGLPAWLSTKWLPTDQELRDFYNSLSIFLLPSHYEGWGLPGVEALACGATLVAADSVGPRDYAKHNETALVVQRSRPDLLAEGVENLLRDDELRRRLARQGNTCVQQYTWDRAVDTLESLFVGV